jgi:hypothetical protein
MKSERRSAKTIVSDYVSALMRETIADAPVHITTALKLNALLIICDRMNWFGIKNRIESHLKYWSGKNFHAIEFEAFKPDDFQRNGIEVSPHQAAQIANKRTDTLQIQLKGTCIQFSEAVARLRAYDALNTVDRIRAQVHHEVNNVSTEGDELCGKSTEKGSNTKVTT